MELWIIRYFPGVADVVRLSDFVPLNDIDPPAKADEDNARKAEAEKKAELPASSAPAVPED